MKTARQKSPFHHDETEEEDVMLLDRILQGKWTGEYDGYSTEKVSLAIVYAEFDVVYKMVQSEYSNGLYLCNDVNRWLTKEEYLSHIESLISGRGHALKNKVNSSFRALYRIIDGVDLRTSEYAERYYPSRPRKPKKMTEREEFDYEERRVLWKKYSKPMNEVRKKFIRKITIKKGNTKEIAFEYLIPVTDYIGKRYIQKKIRLLEETEKQHYFDLIKIYASLIELYVKESDYRRAFFKTDKAIDFLKRHYEYYFFENSLLLKEIVSLREEASANKEKNNADAISLPLRKIAFILPLLFYHQVDNLICALNCSLWENIDSIPESGGCEYCILKKKILTTCVPQNSAT